MLLSASLNSLADNTLTNIKVTGCQMLRSPFSVLHPDITVYPLLTNIRPFSRVFMGWFCIFFVNFKAGLLSIVQ